MHFYIILKHCLKKKEMGLPPRNKRNGVSSKNNKEKGLPSRRIGSFPKEEDGLPQQQEDKEPRNWEFASRKRKDGACLPDGGKMKCW